MNLKRVWFFLSMLVVALACRNYHLDREDVYGVYEATYPFGTDRITLQAEQVYRQVVSISETGEKLTVSGTWTFDAETNRVFLAGCLGPSDGVGNLRTDYAKPFKGGCSYPIGREYLFGQRLRFGPDEGYAHWRIP